MTSPNQDSEPTPALVPIEQALPELQDARFQEVLALDRADRADEAVFSATSGARLARIRDILTAGDLAGSGLWTRYLAARGLTSSVASDRIAAFHGQKRAHVAPERSAPLLQSSAAEAEARIQELEARHTTDTHELAAAHRIIKRQKAAMTPAQRQQVADAERVVQRAQRIREQDQQWWQQWMHFRQQGETQVQAQGEPAAAYDWSEWRLWHVRREGETDEAYAQRCLRAESRERTELLKSLAGSLAQALGWLSRVESRDEITLNTEQRQVLSRAERDSADMVQRLSALRARATAEAETVVEADDHQGA